MDRRQRKTREAIFGAFTELLSKKEFHRITVGEILDKADVGRATFYAHFETKDCLLKEYCAELFCHLFDVEEGTAQHHRHIFNCEGASPVFLHLFEHLQKDDNHILALLSSQNNGLFIDYFRQQIAHLIQRYSALFASAKPLGVPESYWEDHLACVLLETIKWWLSNGRKESPAAITAYFLRVTGVAPAGCHRFSSAKLLTNPL